MNKTIEVTVDGEVYEINVQAAIASGCLTKKHIPITDIEAGDVFYDVNDNISNLLICHSWENYLDNDGHWFFVGLYGLQPYSEDDIKTPTKTGLIDYLNSNNMVFAGNINGSINISLRDIIVKHKRG